MDNRHQLIEGRAELGAKPDQPVPLLGRDRDPCRELTPQDPVLDLQIGDLAGQLFAGSAGDQQQQSIVDVPHDRSELKVFSSMELISFWHTVGPACRMGLATRSSEEMKTADARAFAISTSTAQSAYFLRASVNQPVVSFCQKKLTGSS